MSSWKTILDTVKFDDKGLVTAVAADSGSGEVLMVAYMNAESLGITLDTRIMTYWSRSRQKLWVKGETSGNTQKVVSVKIDCDGDALVFAVEPQGIGAACHTGRRSCFYRELEDGGWQVRGDRMFDPEEVYGKK